MIKQHRKRQFFKRPNKKSIFLLVVIFLILPVFALLLKSFGIIFTCTGSVPIGFYRILPKIGVIKTNDYISFCLPDSVAKMGLQRGYLRYGQCQNKTEELLKEVIAIPGDQVTVADREIKVSHKSVTMDYLAPSRVIDKNGLPVHRFIKNGTYIAKGYWVYGYGSPHYSWDSRYYGAIERKNITHRLVKFWQF